MKKRCKEQEYICKAKDDWKAMHANLWVSLHHNFVYILSFYGHLYDITNFMININCGSFLTLDDNGPYFSMSYFRHFYTIYFMAGSLRPIMYWQFGHFYNNS